MDRGSGVWEPTTRSFHALCHTFRVSGCGGFACLRQISCYDWRSRSCWDVTAYSVLSSHRIFSNEIPSSKAFIKEDSCSVKFPFEEYILESATLLSRKVPCRGILLDKLDHYKLVMPFVLSNMRLALRRY
jgi:hypothetical protein